MKAEEITETLDSSVKGELIRATNSFFSASSAIGDRKITFNATIYNPENNSWEIEFIERTPKGPTYSPTGSGNGLQVFSFVVECVKEVISRYHPNEIVFNSHKADKGRSKLYTRMLDRMNKLNALPGYSFNPTTDINSTKSSDVFRIVKDK